MPIQLLLTAGRWTGPEGRATVPDIHFETIQRAARDYAKSIPMIQSMSTQVLIWCDSERVHNLIGVYDYSTSRLTLV